MPVITIDSPEVVHLRDRDWRLRQLVDAVGDLEYEVTGTAFEQVAHSVVEQMLSMKAGRTIEGRVRELCGGKITSEAIRSLSVDELRSTGVAVRKAQTLLELAERFPEPRLQELAVLPDGEVRDALTSVRGIGKWTADMYLIFYLGRPDVLPVEDGAVRHVFRWLYGAPMTDDNVREVVCSLWRPYSSTAVRYMYRALNTGAVAGESAAGALWV